MNVQDAYDAWAASYDAVANKTRDLEAEALHASVPAGPFAHAVELGCGTGKNTAWLAARATQLTAVDFSTEMLAQARAKLALPNVRFAQADIAQPWTFAAPGSVDLLTCSLILEHLENLDAVFAQAHRALRPGGLFYVGELHPFKQYQGSKARFDTGAGDVFELPCFGHHVSDFFGAAQRAGFRCENLSEWFDADAPQAVPRIVSFVFAK